MVATNSSKVLGTSRDTTSSVSAKPKTASASPSIRNTSSPRRENPSSPPLRLCTNLLRSTSIPSPDDATKALPGRVQCYPSDCDVAAREFRKRAGDEDHEGAEDKPHGKKPHDPHR